MLGTRPFPVLRVNRTCSASSVAMDVLSSRSPLYQMHDRTYTVRRYQSSPQCAVPSGNAVTDRYNRMCTKITIASEYAAQTR